MLIEENTVCIQHFPIANFYQLQVAAHVGPQQRSFASQTAGMKYEVVHRYGRIGQKLYSIFEYILAFL